MKSILGLDIGSHAIKFVEISKDEKSATLLAAGSIQTPPKALTSTAAADLQAISISVIKLLKDAGAKSDTCNIALPESQVFTRVIELPAMSSRELSSAIKWEAEQYIPLPLDQVNIDFSILRDQKQTGKNTMDVLLVAAPKVLVSKYLSIIEMADLIPDTVETEIIAASRALSRSLTAIKTVMIISLGAGTTDISIVRAGVIAFTRSIGAGGEALSRSLAQGLGFELMQAEEFKRTYGLEKDKLQGKIVAAVKPVMDTIISEIKRAVSFYQEKNKEEHIQAVILSGGTARLPGMVVYIAQELGIETQLANPWIGLTRQQRFAVLDPEGASYTVAVGLALH